jgi:cob(I)alamin adenosyltransferase
MKEEDLGLVQVYTGDGKGKTTAALGLALRAAGHGLRTYIGQFMKGQDYGELEAVKHLSPLITIEQFGQPSFVHVKQATSQDVTLAHAGLERVRQALHSGEYDVVVMDEINVALFFELLTVDEVLSVVEGRPPGVELVLTGRRAPDEIIAHADLVTEMREVKHPFHRGTKSRRGIEY